MRWRLKASLGPLLTTTRDAARFIAILRRFRKHLRPQVKPMLLAVLGSLGFTLVTLLEPWPLQVIFDGVLLGDEVKFFGVNLMGLVGNNALTLLAAASIAVLVLAILRGQLYYVQNVLAAVAGLDVVMAIRRELFHHLQMLSMKFHHRARSGDLLMRLTGDIVMLREMVVAALITLLTQGLVILGILIIMAHLNVRLTLVAALVAPALFIILASFRLRLVAAAGKQRRAEGRLASAAHEVLASMQLVQAYTAERFEDDRFKKMNRRSLRSGARVTRIEAQLNRAVQIALAAGICGILWMGTQDVLAGRLSPGELLVFLAYLRGLFRPLRQASKLTQRMAKAAACGDRVVEVLDQIPEIRDPDNPIRLREVQGRISFRDVTFAYTNHQPALRNFSLEVAPGEMVALVGPTGAGKTTVLALIARFFDPQSGEILLDGVPVRAVRLKSLRRQISLLLQETVIMGATIRENIAYGAIGRKPANKVKSGAIARAARKAHAQEFITALPDGYETKVGERGATLSGGQRQRIAIARAILRKAPVLLLDEPTTGLDPVSGDAVLKALEALTKNRTTLVVAHNLATILRANRIVFLKDGRSISQGTHAELLAGCPDYAAFFHTEWGALHRGMPPSALQPGIGTYRAITAPGSDA